MYHGLTPPTFSIPDAVRCVTMAFLQIAFFFKSMKKGFKYAYAEIL